MEQIKVLFGTPAPITYPERDERIGFDIDVECRINGFVMISEYPAEYENEEALKTAVKEIVLKALSDYLKNQNIGRLFFSYKERDFLLKKAIEDALNEKGIRAEASINNFQLVNFTDEEIKALWKEHWKANPSMYIDEMCVAAYAGPVINNTMMAYAGPSPTPGGIGMMFLTQQQMQQQKEQPQKTNENKDLSVYFICPMCGQTGQPSRFCPNCGTPLKDVPLYRDCPACGNRVPADDRFCRECGKMLRDTKEENS